MVIKQHYLFSFLIISTLLACVPAKKYEELKANQQSCKDENASLKSINQSLEEKNNELNAALSALQKKATDLQIEVDAKRLDAEKMIADIESLQKNYDLLIAANNSQSSNNKSATDKLMSQLQKTQVDLQSQEDALRALEASLLKKESDLKKLNSDLASREKRVNELESMINKKDEMLLSLKKKVKDALLGFENNGLTIEQKNGKVYVSLDESLLFASGSYDVGAKGTDVLKKLAKVLETNTDIDVVVEGHTDNVPLKSSGDIQDNWDLSVKRATSVIKIITTNSKINPKQLTAAGRGEYLPLDLSNTIDGRKKNRRIEVILTPKLDELFKLLGE